MEEDQEPVSEHYRKPLQCHSVLHSHHPVRPDHHPAADNGSEHLCRGEGGAQKHSGSQDRRLHALLLEIPSGQPADQDHLLGTAAAFADNRNLCHDNIRTARIDYCMAYGQNRYSGKEGPCLNDPDPIHDSVMVQGVVVAVRIPKRAVRQLWSAYRSRHPCSRLAGIRTVCNNHSHVHALLCILIHHGVRLAEIDQLRA